MGAQKPSMFIGSSVEGKRIAETVQMVLDYDVHCTVWNQGAFGLSGGTLESLVAALDEYDFATLVLTADDLLEKRHVTGRAPRDNVLFELGLFMGALGRERTFILHSRTTPPMLPSDLAGITPATYEERSNLEAALGPACTKIKRAIETRGVRPRLSDTTTKDSDISRLSEMLSQQNMMITELFKRSLTVADHPAGETGSDDMSFFEGSWVSTPPGSHAYCRLDRGIPRVVYCYDGDFAATGEYYDLRRIGDELIGRFRWFDGGIQGFMWLKIDSPTQLSGAWWMEHDVPAKAYNHIEMLKRSRGMNSYTWTKQTSSPKFPAWATKALALMRSW